MRLKDIAFERVVPRNLIGPLREVFLVEDLEADVYQRLTSLRDGPHLGDAVADLDLVRELLVLRDGRVPLVGHAPFVDTELRDMLVALWTIAFKRYPQFLRASTPS